MKNYNVNVITADYAPCYDPSACCNGGGYWQPSGEALVRLEGGTVLHVEYEDTSCGDLGDRWDMDISSGAENWYLHVDYISDDDYNRGYDRGHNEVTYDFSLYRFGVDAVAMVRQIRDAISDAARTKYWDEPCAED